MSNETELEKMNQDLAVYGSSVGRVDYATGEIKHVPLIETVRRSVDEKQLTLWDKIKCRIFGFHTHLTHAQCSDFLSGTAPALCKVCGADLISSYRNKT